VVNYLFSCRNSSFGPPYEMGFFFPLAPL